MDRAIGQRTCQLTSNFGGVHVQTEANWNSTGVIRPGIASVQFLMGSETEHQSIRAVQISEPIWFGVQIIRGLYAIGVLRENRVGLG
jgi:hypothetical protein